MPALRVSIDGTALATVCTDGYDVVSVHVSGTRVDKIPADLHVSGGSHPEDRESAYLMWVNDVPVQRGQVVTVSVLETAPTSHPGKTIDELYPPAEPLEVIENFKPTEAMFAELRSRPRLQEKLAFKLEPSAGTCFAGELAPEEHGFGFSVLWNSFRPNRVSVSLHAYTLEGLQNGDPFNNHVSERLQSGGMVRFQLIA